MTTRETWMVATDFSACSDAALFEAARLLAPLKGTLRLFHVHTPVAPPPAQQWGEQTFELESDLRARLDKVAKAAKAKHPGVDVEIGVIAGEPVAGILAEAERVGADHIVVGTHGRTGLAHLVLGSVAERVVREAKVPVLVVKGDA
jgi:universal stress protein A